MEKVGDGFKLAFFFLFFAGSIRVERPRSHPLCHSSPPKLHRNYSTDGTLRVVVDSRGTLAVGRGTVGICRGSAIHCVGPLDNGCSRPCGVVDYKKLAAHLNCSLANQTPNKAIKVILTPTTPAG